MEREDRSSSQNGTEQDRTEWNDTKKGTRTEQFKKRRNVPSPTFKHEKFTLFNNKLVLNDVLSDGDNQKTLK